MMWVRGDHLGEKRREEKRDRERRKRQQKAQMKEKENRTQSPLKRREEVRGESVKGAGAVREQMGFCGLRACMQERSDRWRKHEQRTGLSEPMKSEWILWVSRDHGPINTR